MTKILLVDDEIELLDTWVEVLRRERSHYQIVTATNGEEALQVIQGERAFDLIVSDIRMPGIDGFELKRQLNVKGIATPIIFLTAYAISSAFVAGRQLGAISFLSKPLTINEFLEGIDRSLELSRVINLGVELLEPVAQLEIEQMSMKHSIALSDDYTIGRSDSANIRLFSRRASREHAVLARQFNVDGTFKSYRIIDYSSNGVKVNGKPVVGYQDLKHGDLIEIPDAQFTYTLLNEQEQTTSGTYSGDE